MKTVHSSKDFASWTWSLTQTVRSRYAFFFFSFLICLTCPDYLKVKHCMVELASLSFQQQPSPSQIVLLTWPHECFWLCTAIWEQLTPEKQPRKIKWNLLTSHPFLPPSPTLLSKYLNSTWYRGPEDTNNRNEEAFLFSFLCLFPLCLFCKLNFNTSKEAYRWFACDVMAAMLVDRKNEIFLLWEITSIFMQTLWTNFLLFCRPTWRQCRPPIGDTANLREQFNEVDS